MTSAVMAAAALSCTVIARHASPTERSGAELTMPRSTSSGPHSEMRAAAGVALGAHDC